LDNGVCANIDIEMFSGAALHDGLIRGGRYPYRERGVVVGYVLR